MQKVFVKTNQTYNLEKTSYKYYLQITKRQNEKTVGITELF